MPEKENTFFRSPKKWERKIEKKKRKKEEEEEEEAEMLKIKKKEKMKDIQKEN